MAIQQSASSIFQVQLSAAVNCKSTRKMLVFLLKNLTNLDSRKTHWANMNSTRGQHKPKSVCLFVLVCVSHRHNFPLYMANTRTRNRNPSRTWPATWPTRDIVRRTPWSAINKLVSSGSCDYLCQVSAKWGSLRQHAATNQPQCGTSLQLHFQFWRQIAISARQIGHLFRGRDRKRERCLFLCDSLLESLLGWGRQL